MSKQIPLLTLIVVALTALTCYGFHRLTPSAPCDAKEITLITGFWLLIAVVIVAISRWIWKRKSSPDH
jgi:hypothetical protein